MRSLMEKYKSIIFYLKYLQNLLLGMKYKLNRVFHEKFLFKLASKENVFTSIWSRNYWGSGESLSGPGSTLEQTANIRNKMPVMFENLGIKSVFDAPCGDMHWMQHLLENAKFNYLGGDIVSGIVMANKSKFANKRISFTKFDITSDDFPTSDVWLCRAVFFHLSNHDIYLSLEQFASSNIKYLLTTNCITNDRHVNLDIVTGDWRSLNLLLYPFNFPRDFLWEIEDCLPPHPPMTLTLWTKAQIESILPDLRKVFKK